MLSAVVFVPSPPLLSERLSGSATHELDDLRSAVRAVCTSAREVSDSWVAVGAGASTRVIDASEVGTYVGFGVDVVVRLSPESAGEPDRSMDLAALTVGLVREQSAADLSVPVHLVRFDADGDECASVASTVRAAIDAADGPVGLLVVGDGATTLTDKAPGAFDSRAEALQNEIDDALENADVSALASLDPALCRELGVGGRAAWQVAAAIVGDASVTPTTLYRGAPYGVGYYVGSWEL